MAERDTGSEEWDDCLLMAFTFDPAAAVAAGMDDELIVAEIMRDTRCDEVMAWQTLAMAKGEPRENWDDCIVEVDPSFPQPRRPKDRAKTLDVCVGGDVGFQAVELNGGRLMWHEFRSGVDKSESAERLDDPAPEQWAEFWRELDRLDVFAWAERYVGGATDSYCGVEIEHEGRRVVMDGVESGYPPNFEAFCAAVARLTGREFYPDDDEDEEDEQ